MNDNNAEHDIFIIFLQPRRNILLNPKIRESHFFLLAMHFKILSLKNHNFCPLRMSRMQHTHTQQKRKKTCMERRKMWKTLLIIFYLYTKCLKNRSKEATVKIQNEKNGQKYTLNGATITLDKIIERQWKRIRSEKNYFEL